MCRISSESISIESMRADLSRVRRQYFFKDYPKNLLQRGSDPAAQSGAVEKNHLR
jgi:hypothetical protein